MSTYKAIDSKKEEFRKYLEKAGVMDVLTKVLVGLYEEPEKPDDALDYLKNFMVQKSPSNLELEMVKMELSELKCKYDQLLAEHQQLRDKSELVTTSTEETTAEDKGETEMTVDPAPETTEPAQ